MQLLTPTEIWEGFNPVKEPTETSIISSRENDNLVATDLFFTSEKTAGGRVRVFSRIFYDARWRDARPAILLLPSHEATRKFDDITVSLVKEGYVVCLCDYAGNFAGDDESKRTVYPPELSYAGAPQCFDKLYDIKTTGRETPWFQWAKAARRAITMLSELKYVDADRIAVMGTDCGAEIAWQVAGMDGRVRALVPINGGGYLWLRGKSRFEDNTLPVSDEERAFSAGVGAETYAKFVSCPTCYIVSSNSIYTDVDRAGDILSLVPAKAKALMIVRGSASQISYSVYDSLIRWMSKNFAHDSDPVKMPSVAFKADENNLYLHVRCSFAPKALYVYVSRGETVSFARYWTSLKEGQLIGDNEYAYFVPPADSDEPVMAFASAEADDGIIVSSPVEGVVPSSLGVKTHRKVPTGQGRLLYTGDMGTGLFWVTTDDFFLDDKILSQKEGPFGIKGVSTSKGNLILCRSTKAEYSCDKSAVLQLDAYSPEERCITVSFRSYPELTRYSCRVKLTGGDFWQKVKLSASMFKSEEGRTLSKFGVCKQLIISDAENVVFNNLVWI